MIRRPPRSTPLYSSAASDVYKRQVFNCIKALVPHEAKLELYQVHAVTEGTDAQAEVSVRLAHEGRSMTAKGADPDTLVASAKAYLGALNKIVMKHQRDMPAQVAG